MTEANENIRILHCITDKSVGGAGVLLYNLITESDNSRFVHGVVLPEESKLLARLKQTKALLFPLSVEEKSLSPKDFFTYHAVISAFAPHILHTHGCFTARLVGSLLKNAPFCIYTKHCIFESRRSRRPLLGKLSALATAFCTHAVVASASCAAQQLVKEGVSPKRILTIENGVRPLFHPSALEKERFLAAFNIKNKFPVGFCGRLEEDKNPFFFLELAKSLARDGRFVFLMIGDGSMRQHLEKKVKREGLCNLLFLGHYEDVSLPLSTLFAIVNTSTLSETSNLALLEAAGLGVPPVASDCGGNRALIEPQNGGMLYPKNDVGACKEALLYMADHPALYRHLQLGARKIGEAHTARKTTKKYELLYEELFKRKK